MCDNSSCAYQRRTSAAQGFQGSSAQLNTDTRRDWQQRGLTCDANCKCITYLLSSRALGTCFAKQVWFGSTPTMDVTVCQRIEQHAAFESWLQTSRAARSSSRLSPRCAEGKEPTAAHLGLKHAGSAVVTYDWQTIVRSLLLRPCYGPCCNAAAYGIDMLLGTLEQRDRLLHG